MHTKWFWSTTQDLKYTSSTTPGKTQERGCKDRRLESWYPTQASKEPAMDTGLCFRMHIQHFHPWPFWLKSLEMAEKARPAAKKFQVCLCPSLLGINSAAFELFTVAFLFRTELLKCQQRSSVRKLPCAKSLNATVCSSTRPWTWNTVLLSRLRKSGRGAALVHLTSLSKAENEVSAAHTGQSFAFLQAYVLFLW